MSIECLLIINNKINYQSAHSTQVTGTLIYAVHSVVSCSCRLIIVVTSNHHKKLRKSRAMTYLLLITRNDTYNLQLILP